MSRFIPSTTDEEINAGARIAGCLFALLIATIASLAGLVVAIFA